ncbi:MAG TPA: septation protein SepH [Streptosporangiaceae bacterium]
MQELRLVAVSEDGSYAVLAVPGRSGRFALPIDERLRTVARGQFSRLAQYEIEVESPLRPKEIQDRIRAGETAEEIADAAGLPVDRIRRFEGPVLAEREFRAQEAQRATVRGRTDRRAESGPAARLGEVVTGRLSDLGASPDDVEWDSRKRQDGCWQVQLAYTLAGRMHVAEWVYDPRSKHVTPDDDEAIRLCLDEDQWPEPRSAPRPVVTATVTRIGSRSDSRSETERSGSRGAPSRQVPAGVAAAAGSAHGQGATPLRMPGPDAEVATAAARSGQITGSERGPAKSAPEAARDDAQDVVAATQAATAAAAGTAAAVPAETAPEPAEEAQPARPARRASGGRSRRSSVPSWDEIMFGTSRQPE